MNEHMKVRIGPEVFLYSEKAPFEKSGLGELGALRLDPDLDQVMCHECGGWYRSLFAHVQHGHGMDVRDYKKKHGLHNQTALCSEHIRVSTANRTMALLEAGVITKLTAEQSAKGVKASMAARKKGLGPRGRYRNLNGHCTAQLLNDLRELGKKLKRTPRVDEIQAEIGVNSSTFHHRFGSLANAMEAAGLKPRRVGELTISWHKAHPRAGYRYTDEQLLSMMSNFAKTHKRRPLASDGRRGLLPRLNTYAARFGSWKKALAKAGVEYGLPRPIYQMRKTASA